MTTFSNAVSQLLNSVWSIDAERACTRVACAEVLARLPGGVISSMLRDHKVVVVAPKTGSAATIIPVRATSAPALSATGGHMEGRIFFLFLGDSIETDTHDRAVGRIAKAVASACIGAGIAQSSSVPELLGQWGFQRETEELRRGHTIQ